MTSAGGGIIVFLVMTDKISDAIKALRKTTGLKQIEFAKRLGIGVPSLTHYETAGRGPDAATTARFARMAYEAGRVDLAEVLAAALPGVEDGLLVPVWRLSQELRPPAPTDEGQPSQPTAHRMPEPKIVDVQVQYVSREELERERAAEIEHKTKERRERLEQHPKGLEPE